jgi:hypothetical protein
LLESGGDDDGVGGWPDFGTLVESERDGVPALFRSALTREGGIQNLHHRVDLTEVVVMDAVRDLDRRPLRSVVSWCHVEWGTALVYVLCHSGKTGLEPTCVGGGTRADGCFGPPGGLPLVDVSSAAETLGDGVRVTGRRYRASGHGGGSETAVDGSDRPTGSAVPALSSDGVRHNRHCTLDMDPPASRSCIGAARAKIALAGCRDSKKRNNNSR